MPEAGSAGAGFLMRPGLFTLIEERGPVPAGAVSGVPRWRPARELRPKTDKSAAAPRVFPPGFPRGLVPYERRGCL